MSETNRADCCPAATAGSAGAAFFLAAPAPVVMATAKTAATRSVPLRIVKSPDFVPTGYSGTRSYCTKCRTLEMHFRSNSTARDPSKDADLRDIRLKLSHRLTGP